MLIRCIGSAEKPHEEVQWLGMKYPDGFCWYCDQEGTDLTNKVPISKVSIAFRHPA